MEEIDPRDLLVQTTKILERLAVAYVVTGGMAVYVWGRPRFTADVDIAIALRPEDIGALQRALRELSDAGYVDKEMMEEAVARRGVRMPHASQHAARFSAGG